MHRSGDRCNYKCTLKATDAPIIDIPGETNKERPQPGLKENPAKTKQIFDKSHPYFSKSCKGCKFSKGLKNKLTGWFTNADGDCYKCVNIITTKKQTDLQKRLVKYNEDDRDKTYVTPTGFVVTQKKRIAEGKVSKNEIDKYNKELTLN